MNVAKTPPDDLTERLLAVGEAFLTDDPPQRLQDVAQAVGVSRASLYYYFSGRDDLVAFLVTEHAKEAGAAISRAVDGAGADPETRLRAAVAELTAFLTEHPGLCSGVLGSMGTTAGLTEVVAVNERWVAGPLAALLEPVLPDGGSDPGEAALTLLGALLFGVLGRWASGADLTDKEFQARLSHQVLAGVTG